MKKVFISGSRSFKQLPSVVKKRLEKLIEEQCLVLIGDAKGVDALVQDFFKERKWFRVVVYSIGDTPRVLKSEKFIFKKIEITDASLRQERERQAVKDQAMTKDADISIVVWDGKSKGSYHNILRALENDKKVEVFLDGAFLPEEEITKTRITEIFNERSTYSLSQYLQEVLKKEGSSSNIKNVKQMRAVLQKENILVDPEIYEEKHQKYVSIKVFKGRKTLSYQKKLLDAVFLKKSFPLEEGIVKEITKESGKMQLRLF